MINDNDLFLLASSQNNGTYKVYIDSNGYKTLTPQTRNYTAKYREPYISNHEYSVGLLYDITSKKEVIFPNCSEATGAIGYGAFEFAFWRCPSLTSVSFPSLTTASGDSSGSSSSADGAFERAFAFCTSLTSVSFPSLTTAIGSSGSRVTYGVFERAFEDCTSLTSVSFPSLTSVGSNSFNTAFSNCSSSLKVHFKKSMKGTAGLDYKTMALTSEDQVVFDLP